MATNVMGTLPSNSTWTPAGNPWVLTGDVTVPQGVSLTIEPGVEITFAKTDGMGSGADTSRTELIVSGTLAVQGSSSAPVTLTATGAYGVRVLSSGTAIVDYTTLNAGLYGVVSAGSSTLNNTTIKGALTTALNVTGGTTSFTNGTLQDSNQALFSSGGTSNLNYSLVKNSGSSSGYYAIQLDAAANLIHNTITANKYSAIAVSYFSTGQVSIYDNIISSNSGWGLTFSSSSYPSRSIHHNNVWGNSSGNHSNVSPGTGSISANPLFVSTSNFRITEYSPARQAASDGSDMGAFAYTGNSSSVLQGLLLADKTLTGANTLSGDLTVAPGVTLTLAPGASLTFATSDGAGSGADTSKTELIVSGTLAVQGSSSAPVTLTATGAYGVRVLSSGTAIVDYTTLNAGLYGLVSAGSSTLNNTTIKGALTTALNVTGGTTSFTNGTLQDSNQALFSSGGTSNLSYSLVKNSGSSSGYYAIQLDAAANLIHNTITANKYSAIAVSYFSTGQVSIYDNIISSNSGWGLTFSSSSYPSRSIHHNNVWGNSSGNHSNVSPGTGSISANPLFVSTSNYRLTEYSPARQAASDGSDMGAFAYTGTPSSVLQGVLLADKTLTGANTLSGDLTVAPGVTLTLAPGASLTFATSDGAGSGADTSKTELIVSGTLAVQGSSSAPVTLTATGAYGVRVLASGTAIVDYTTLNAGLYGVVSAGSSTLNNTTIKGALTTALNVTGGTTSFTNGTLQDSNQALYSSGGTSNLNYSLVKNSGSSSGYYAIQLDAAANLIHNTITANKYSAIAVSYFSTGQVSIYDNIISSNSGWGLTFSSSSYPSRSIHHNNVWGNSSGNHSNVSPGTGSISANPLFVGPSTFTLQETSPCRNAASDGRDIGAFSYAVVPVASIILTPSIPTLVAQGTQQFTATALDANNNPLSGIVFTWSASSAAGSINSNGLFTAGCTPGTYSGAVTATAAGKSASAQVTINPGSLTTVSVSPASINVPINRTQQFTATARDACGNALSSAPISWAVTAGGGTISTSGLFTAGSTLGTYTNTVRATSGTVYGSASVTVTGATLASIVVTPSVPNLIINGTQQFTATGKDVSGNTVPVTVTWSVINGGGSISSSGLFTAGTTPGTYANTIRATATSNGISGFGSVTVQPGALASIQVSPSTATLGVNSMQPFFATGRDVAGNTVPVSVTWSVVNGGGTITSDGMFTAGPTPGTYASTILATSGDIFGSASVELVSVELLRVVISRKDPTLVPGGMVAFSAKAFGPSGRELTGRKPTWEVVNGGGTIDSAGVFTAGKRSGKFADTIQVTLGGKSARASVAIATDSDGDGMSDEWELEHGFDPNKPGDAMLDADGDKLLNVDEFEMGTDPRDADTDGDGVTDGSEPRPTEDADGDNLPNCLDPDSDNDGLSDGIEMAASSALEASSKSHGRFVPDADPKSSTDPLTADTDDDGIPDGEEDANHNGRVDGAETDPNKPDVR
ncbi:beta strand repeat-containing protein [Hyalangium versicolor]|uniref:beta strand repeat-containing protein n=1 Tax=Hyalangium versicolor TaxID=2861190 RepID=UPI001CCE38BD|nr:right-handed parallel beta-helix repeat-containing protein [Hyalangium versicolor]